jgi:uncharacterized membrane protein
MKGRVKKMVAQWYLYKAQQQSGPMNWEQLLEQAKTGLIGPSDLVWSEGMADWVKADQVEGLIVAAPPPEPATAPPPPGVSVQQNSSPKSYPDAYSEVPWNDSSTGARATVGAKSSTGLEPNIAAMLSYLFGWITGIIFYLIENQNKFVRFHAMQSIVTFGGLTVLQVFIWILRSLIWTILWRGMGSWAIAGTLTSLLGIISMLIWLATLGLAVLLMIKAYQYETYKLPIVGKIAEKQL